MPRTDITNLWIKKDTRERLKQFGEYADTYDMILNKLMDKAQTSTSSLKGKRITTYDKDDPRLPKYS